MEIIPSKYKQKCELGACRNTAAYTVRFDRAGIRSRLHLCGCCLVELARVTGEAARALAKADGGRSDSRRADKQGRNSGAM